MPRFEDYARASTSPLLSRTRIQPFEMMKWDGGWRPDKAPSELAPNELQSALNIEYTAHGGVKKRGGMLAMTDAVSGLTDIEMIFAPRVYTLDNPAAPAPQPIFNQWVFAFNTSDGSIYYQILGQLYEEFIDSAEGADFIDSGHSLGNAGGASSNYFRIWPINVLTWQDNVYMTSLRYNGFSGGSGAGGDWETQSGATGSPSLPIRFDAQDVTFTRPAVHDLDDSTSGFPRARCAFVKHDRIFAANVHKAGVYRYPSRIYWSDAGTSETWGTNSWIEVGGDDGTEITAVVPMGEQIIIFKNQSIYTLAGTDEDTFALYPLDKSRGCEGTYSADSSSSEVFFFDENTSSIWSYNGSQFDEIGAPVRRYIQANINHNAASKAVIQVVGDTLWFSFAISTPNSTQAAKNELTLAFDLKLRAWALWDFGIVPSVLQRFSDFVASEPDGALEGDALPYFVNPDAGTVLSKGYMGQDDDGDTPGAVYSDYGSTFNMNFHTFWLQPGGGKNRIRRAEFLIGDQSKNATIVVATHRDLYPADWVTYNINFTDWNDTVVEFHHQTSKVDAGRFTWLAFEVDSTTSTNIRINSIRMEISSERHPRGAVQGTQYHETEVGQGTLIVIPTLAWVLGELLNYV